MADQGSPLVAVATSAVQMRHARIHECIVRANPQFPKIDAGQLVILDPFPISLSTIFGKLPESESQDLYAGQITLELAEGTDAKQGNEVLKPPYFFKFVIEGLFQWIAKGHSEDVSPDQYVAVHGTAALTAVARELLAHLTARSTFGPVILPSMLFGRNAESVKSGVVGDLRPATK